MDQSVILFNNYIGQKEPNKEFWNGFVDVFNSMLSQMDREGQGNCARWQAFSAYRDRWIRPLSLVNDGGTAGAMLGGPLGASIGASLGKTVSDGTQFLLGGGKSAEQRRMEEALAALRGGQI